MTVVQLHADTDAEDLKKRGLPTDKAMDAAQESRPGEGRYRKLLSTSPVRRIA